MDLQKYLQQELTKFIDKPKIFKYVYVYRDLRRRGRKVSIKEDTMFLNQEEVIPVFENDFFACKEGLYGVIDQDGDITYYRCINVEMEGEGTIEDFVGVCSVFENIALHSGGVFSAYYAKYLSEKGRVKIKKGNVNNKIYSVYQDLVNRGLIPRSGLKYGSHFRVYASNKSKHSEYLVAVMPPYPNFVDLAAKSRVAHAVKKTLIHTENTEKVKYYEYRWVRI